MAQHATINATDSEPPESGQPSLAAVKIKAFRQREGLTATRLGKLLGVSQAAVLFWEHGRRIPRPDTQRQLQAMDICSPNDWYDPAPDSSSNDNPGEGAE